MSELEIFMGAFQIAEPNERKAWLDRECGDDVALRRRVDDLLEAHEEAGSLLERPAVAMTGSLDSTTVEHAGTVIGAYKLLEQIGEGGFGVVFAAEQSKPIRRKVALKILKPGMDTRQVVARFEAERQALAIMDHPNIARVFDGGVTGTGRPYFVMELVRGVPITEYCDQNHLAPRQRLELFVTICQALQHAHQKGIIHRDLKPSNILVSRHDTTPVVKVIDFGVAKALGQELTDKTLFTGVAQMIGTPLYMSPEQAGMSDLDIDTRSDIYSLGVLLYELLTGSTPFSKERFKKAAYDEIRRIIREEDPPKPSTRISESTDILPSVAANRGVEPKKLGGLIRGELDWIVMKALEKDRDRRYETANGFAADVLRYLSDEPIEARPSTFAYWLKKFLKRNRGVVIAASLLSLSLIGGIVGTTIGLLRAREKEQHALAAANRAERARDRTHDVLDAMISDATGDSLSTQKAISAEQKKFLEGVLTYYHEFAGDRAEDEQSRMRTAKASFKVGAIEFRLGRPEQSFTAFSMARDLFAALAADFPAVPDYRQDQAICLRHLARQLNAFGKSAEAEAHCRAALDIQEKLAAEFPSFPEYQQKLAESSNSLGIILERLGKSAESETACRQALAIRNKLAAEFRDAPEHRRELGMSHCNLGNLLGEHGKRDEAETEFGQALAIQEKLAAEFLHIPEYRQELARSRYNLGSVLDQLGKREAAEAAYRIALTVQENLVANFPAVPEYRADLANSLSNLGTLLGTLKKGAEAETLLRRAVAIQEKLADESPAVPVFRHGLAVSLNNLNVLLGSLGRLPETEAVCRRAVAIQEKLAADFPAFPKYRQDLAMSHLNLGALLQDLGKGAESEAACRRAMTIQEKLADDFPAVPEYQFDLGCSYGDFGYRLRTGGRAADSLEWYARSIRTLALVYERKPRDAAVRRFLLNSYGGRAMAHVQLHNDALAVADWNKAIELSLKEEQFGLRALRASSQLRAGQMSEAVAEAAELTKQSIWNPAQWYDFACIYAVASGKSADKKQLYAARAIELLQVAVKAGWKDVPHMQKDPELDSLRTRDDFKKLIAQLEAKAPPKSKDARPAQKGK